MATLFIEPTASFHARLMKKLRYQEFIEYKGWNFLSMNLPSLRAGKSNVKRNITGLTPDLPNEPI